MILNLSDHGPRPDLTLAPGSVLDLRPPKGGLDLRARQGTLWITQTGDPEDHVLAAGETFHAEGGGLVVVQALEASRLGL